MSSFNWELVAMGLDAAACVLFYTLYHKYTKDSEVIKAAPDLETGTELKKVLKSNEGQALPYVCVSGRTEPMCSSNVLHSRHAESETGVIQKVKLMEHRTRRNQGFWSDFSNVLRDTVNTVPFQLQTADGSTIEITEPLSADFLEDALKVTHHHFEPDKSNLMERTMDRLFGDVPKGVQESEKMLGIGVRLLGVGQLMLHKGQPQLVPPEDGKRYILTNLSRRELLKMFQSYARFFKGMLLVSGTIGVGLVLYCTYKLCARWKENYDMRRAMEEFRQMRQRQQEGVEDGEYNPDQQCVVCLNSPREVVLLDCGHICMCTVCAHALPDPKQCPMCRSNVVRFIPVYMA